MTDSFYPQLNNLGWSVIFVTGIVWDLRAKICVAPLFAIIGWCLFRISPPPPFSLNGES